MSRWRFHIPLQAVGIVVTLARAVLVYVLVGMLAWKIDDMSALHWTVWLTYWSAMGLNIFCWALYTLLDVDGDGAEGLG